jgi:hypothetical protein
MEHIKNTNGNYGNEGKPGWKTIPHTGSVAESNI